jgi:hypothetical protein
MGKWTYSSTSDLGNRCRSVVTFTLRPLYLRGNRPRYPLNRRLGGPKSRCGRRGGFCPDGNRTRAVQPAARCYPDFFLFFVVSKGTAVFLDWSSHSGGHTEYDLNGYYTTRLHGVTSHMFLWDLRLTHLCL